MRTAIAIVLVTGFAVSAQRSTPGIKPTSVTFKKDATVLGEVAAELSKVPAGVTVKVDPPASAKAKCSAAFEGTPFWEALETAADQTKTRLVLREGGRVVVLEPRPAAREISAVSGPFRVVPRSVTGRLLLDQGVSFHDVDLDVHWEPRMPVFRIDTQPRITKALDDRGTVLKADGGSSQHYPTTAMTEMKVRLAGLTRESKQIATLEGEFRATVSEKLLTIPFKDLTGKFPMTIEKDGVTVVLKSFKKEASTWDAELELTYPEGHPNFESFEEQKWLRDNRLRLMQDATPWEPDNDDVTAPGRKVNATYRFKLLGNANPIGKGWSLVCETPTPLVEVRVPVALKNIPLP
ncbi:MAG: hypothetical protein K8U57_15000 [Planctomycetes bacterium]|nr:hypothetical protein [Planctomycetota bacterium]